MTKMEHYKSEHLAFCKAIVNKLCLVVIFHVASCTLHQTAGFVPTRIWTRAVTRALKWEAIVGAWFWGNGQLVPATFRRGAAICMCLRWGVGECTEMPLRTSRMAQGPGWEIDLAFVCEQGATWWGGIHFPAKGTQFES